MRRRRRILLALPAAVAIVAFTPAASHAFVGCSHSAGTLKVFLNEPGDGVSVARGGDAINVFSLNLFDEGPSILLACAGGAPTVHNTDLVVVDEAAATAFTAVAFDLTGGPFAPGMTPEADGSSEIELQANVFGVFSFTGVGATAGDDVIQIGRAPSGATGFNLNAGAEPASPDVDLEVSQPEFLSLVTGRGSDTIDSTGGPGFVGPIPNRAFLITAAGAGRDELVAGGVSVMSGGGGDDRLLGSRRLDAMLGGRGRDVMKSGKGNDIVFARRGGRDRVACGAGRKDVGFVDDADRAGGCELDRLPRRQDDEENLTIFAARLLSAALPGRPPPAGYLDAALDLLKRK